MLQEQLENTEIWSSGQLGQFSQEWADNTVLVLVLTQRVI